MDPVLAPGAVAVAMLVTVALNVPLVRPDFLITELRALVMYAHRARYNRMSLRARITDPAHKLARPMVLVLVLMDPAFVAAVIPEAIVRLHRWFVCPMRIHKSTSSLSAEPKAMA
jgi:hypothetical protein